MQPGICPGSITAAVSGYFASLPSPVHSAYAAGVDLTYSKCYAWKSYTKSLKRILSGVLLVGKAANDFKILVHIHT
jgi:hypothetical protein